MSTFPILQTRLRTCIGIDVSSETFNVSISSLSAEGKLIVLGSSAFKNDADGYQKFLAWVKKILKTEVLTTEKFVMEATGVYYEELAYFLHNNKLMVYVVLPFKTKNYFKSETKTKTDKVDAKLLSKYGLEKIDLRPWQPFSPKMLEIKKLTRYREELVKASTAQKNRLHACNRESHPSQLVIDLIEKSIESAKAEIKQIDKELIRLINEDVKLKEVVRRLKKVPGLDTLSICVILSETDGFVNFKNRRQVIAYVGLDIPQKDSGKRVRKINAISKMGNAHIRRILYIPAIHYKNKDAVAGQLFDRLKYDKCGRVAVGRKLLTLIFALVKSGKEYDPDYRSKKGATSNEKPVVCNIKAPIEKVAEVNVTL